uniref:Arrestin-like N-terminal domain-containing protein n=1 Tax=Psilocybe cubensis TaxID=181762 RepID=A0A8H7YBS9_PSICU
MPDIQSNEETSLRSSVYSVALSINTILPQYSDSAEEADAPSSFEQDIRGKTLRFQVLSAQRPQYRTRASRSSFQSDRTVLPPRYSTISTSHPTVEQPNEDSLVVQHYEHAFSVQSKKPWATVYLFTPKTMPGMPKSSQTTLRVPVIYGQEPVLGMLELDIDSPKGIIEQITVALQGKVWNWYSESSTKILDQSYLLWHKLSPVKDGKLLGSHQMPFSFQLGEVQRRTNEDSDAQLSDLDTSLSPLRRGQIGGSSKWSPKLPGSSRVFHSQPDLQLSPYEETRSQGAAYKSKMLSSSRGQSVRSSPLRASASSPRLSDTLTRADLQDPLPPSFKERGIPASVEYTLSVRIQRRLRPDNIIKTEVSYVPLTIARAASSKRQSAHAAGAVAPGPYHDPEGWFALPEASMKGEVDGRPILISSKVTHAHIVEERLSPADAPLVRLTRRLRQFEIHKSTRPLGSSPVTPFRDKSALEFERECTFTKCTILTLAMWRALSKRDLESLDNRNCYLEGEIHLEDDLVPSYSSRLFSIEYNVELLPLISDSFKASHIEDSTNEGDSKGILSSCLVEITTLRPPEEPVPVKFTKPPQYGKFPEVKKEESDTGWNNRSFEQFGLI